MKRRNRIKATLQRGLARALVLCPLVFVLVAGAGCPSLFESSTQRATHIRQAVAGRDGDFNVTALNTVVNVYAQLAGTTANTITVTDVNANFLSAVSPGDLLLIVQMAGATMDVTDTDSYGAVSATNLGNAGHYEFVGVESVSGNVITLACALQKAYSPTGKTQVVRVPQYGTLTISNGASITSGPNPAVGWNGVTGGVVAVHAETTVHLNGNGSINVSEKGFRGGTAHNSNPNVGGAVVLRSTVTTSAAQKGEGIAGFGAEYDALNGQYGRGAPANAGGGGNSHNAGGGGGANARSGVAWTGQGVMTVSVANDATAWAQEPGYVAAKSTAATASEGGGRGGYSYSNSGTPSPLTSGPTATFSATCAWGGDCRRETGGLGGHPLDNSPASRLFMGGGGGAGDGNNGVAGDGGNGGGLIFVIAGTVDGSGSLSANGQRGFDSSGAQGTNGDAAGGGGGGGTVVVHAVNIAGTWTIAANGGAGGRHANSSGPNEVEGPGGGGGGGYIAVSGGGTSDRWTAGSGQAGTTTVTTSVMSTFRANGATAGNAGQTNGDATSFLYCGVTGTAPVATIQTGPAQPSTTSTTGTFTFQATEEGLIDADVALGVGAVTFECKLDNGAFASCSSPFTIPTALGIGHHIFTVIATDLSGNKEPGPPYDTVSIWAWDVLGLDAGAEDGGAPGVDLGVDTSAEDSSGAEVPPALLDAEGIDESVDAQAADALPVGPDAGKSDVLRDVPVAKTDTPLGLVVDASADGDVGGILPVLDSGGALDGQALLLDGAGADLLADARLSSDAAAKPDTATIADLNADTAAPVTEDAALPPANEDAAPPSQVSDIKILGGGFCAIASSHSTPSMPFLVMALAALALFRRRRDR